MTWLKKLFAAILHRAAHWSQWNEGRVETWRDPNGKLMVGFRCSCGEMMDTEDIDEERLWSAIERSDEFKEALR